MIGAKAMKETVFLQGKNIYLRPVLSSDFNGPYLRWINDQNNDIYTDHARLPKSVLDLENYAQEKWNDKNCIWLAIIEVEGKHHIGNIELSNIDLFNRDATFSIILDNEYHGRKFGTEASQLLIAHAFKRLNLSRISLGVNEINLPALKLYQKLGFKEEGRKRKAILINGNYYDAIFMGMLFDEWNELVDQ